MVSVDVVTYREREKGRQSVREGWGEEAVIELVK